MFDTSLLRRTKIEDPMGGLNFGKAQFKSRAHLAHHLTNGSFSILSAENPNNEPASPEENKQRTLKLEQDLKSIGASYHPSIGKFGGGKENSFIVHHTASVQPHHLEDLAQKYGQQAILHWSKNSGRVQKFDEGKTFERYSGHNINRKVDNYFTKPRELGVKGKFQTLPDMQKSKAFNVQVTTPEGSHDIVFHAKPQLAHISGQQRSF